MHPRPYQLKLLRKKASSRIGKDRKEWIGGGFEWEGPSLNKPATENRTNIVELSRAFSRKSVRKVYNSEVDGLIPICRSRGSSQIEEDYLIQAVQVGIPWTSPVKVVYIVLENGVVHKLQIVNQLPRNGHARDQIKVSPKLLLLALLLYCQIAPFCHIDKEL